MFSLIIPVYNRPDELAELLESLSKSNYKESFEVVIVEDGSTLKCDSVVAQYNSKLSISYFLKLIQDLVILGISACKRRLFHYFRLGLYYSIKLFDRSRTILE
jgi:glycosyltransferase involved in cell wall biosynthesis